MGENIRRSSQNHGINVTRLICSILVIVIHSQAFFGFSRPLGLFFSEYVARIAVPFFFLVTGYYLYTNIKRTKYVYHYIKKSVSFYLKWTLLMFILMLIFGYTSTFENLEILTMKILLFGIIPSYWYIPSLIIGVLFVTYFFKHNKWKILFALCIPLYCLGLAGDSYFGLAFDTPLLSLVKQYNFIFENTRNGLTFSPIFLALGGWLAYAQLHLKLKYVKSLLILALSLWGMEVYWLIENQIARDFNMYIGLLFVIPLLFILIIQYRGTVKVSLGTWAKETSIGVYFMHEMILIVLWTNALFVHTFTNFIVCTILTFIIVFVMRKVPFFRSLFSV